MIFTFLTLHMLFPVVIPNMPFTFYVILHLHMSNHSSYTSIFLLLCSHCYFRVDLVISLLITFTPSVIAEQTCSLFFLPLYFWNSKKGAVIFLSLSLTCLGRVPPLYSCYFPSIPWFFTAVTAFVVLFPISTSFLLLSLTRLIRDLRCS